MPKATIDAKEALDAIRAGMDDHALMDKFRLSAKGLQSLFRKLLSSGVITQAELDRRASDSLGNVQITRYVSEQAKSEPQGRLVNAYEAAKDIRGGLGDAELMEKYRLSSKGLQNLFDKLVESGVVKQSEIDRRAVGDDSTVSLIGILKQLGLDRTAKKETAPVDVPNRCVACGAPQTMEFEECPVCGTNIPEYKAKLAQQKQAGKTAWTCPACGRSQDRPYDECPICGVIVAKFGAKGGH